MGASAAKRTENGVRGRQGREKRWGDTKGKEISGRNMNGRGKEEGTQCNRHGDYKPGDDGLTTEDLE